MIHVLHYAPGFESGGIESRLLDWYRNIDREKIKFILIKLNTIDNSENIKEFCELGGKFYNLPPISLSKIIDFELTVKKIILKEKIDIVHVHDTNSGVFVLNAAKKAGVKHRIYHSRTTDFLPNERSLLIKKFLMKIAPFCATEYFACSKEAAVFAFGEKKAKNATVVKNGIQTEYFLFDNNKRHDIRNKYGVDDKIVIGSIGRLSPQKNVLFLLELIKDLHSLDGRYVLMLVGGGDTQEILKFITANNLSDCVILTGNKKNVWDFYSAIDIFVGASLYEGFGTTAIEAQASGLPTIISEGFPKTVCISSLIYRISTAKMNEWIKTILAITDTKRCQEEGLKSVRENGYSASDVAKWLQEFYESKVLK